MTGDTKIERYTVPTVETVMTIGVDRETAEKVVAVLNGTLDPCEASSSCAAWVAACYHKPDTSKHEAKLNACSELLGMHDIAGLDIDDARYTDEGIRMCPPFSYCNAGDPYVTTLIRDHAAGQWIIGCWADCLEEYEKEHKIGDHEEFDECPEECPSCGKSSFSLDSYEPGKWVGGEFVKDGTTRYFFACDACNHHCQCPEDFVPRCDTCGETHAHLYRTKTGWTHTECKED